MAGESGHPFRGGFGPKHKYQLPPRHEDFTDRYNPFRRGLESLFYKAAPTYRNLIGFETPDWVDEYIDRDVPDYSGGITDVAEIDPSDWRRLEQILAAGLDPEDYT